jgi:toxin ParE1/3/4
MRILGYHPEAQEELDDALARSFNPIAFQDKVDAAIGEIGSELIVYPLFNSTIARECPLPRLPYSLIYTDENQELYVMAVAHHKRRPGYWKYRLRKS